MQVKTQRTVGRSRAGQETAQRVIESARALLMREGYAQFSMRNVASHASMHLANVQYYFPTREALVRALLTDTGARYRAAYEKLLTQAPVDRVERFKAVVDYNLRDVASEPTRRFFIQLWALLSTLDGDSNELLNELYRIDLEQLSERIAELEPAVEPAEVRRRATLLAAMIEGLVLVRGAHSDQPAELRRLMTYAHTMALQIARGAAWSA